jgi:DNA-nicking Smr family endonuclease
MGRKTRKGSGDRAGGRRGKRRSIRYDATEEPADKRPRRDSDAPPQIQLRKLGVEEALARLETQLRAYQRQGRRELLVIHGRGHGSPGQIAVLAPAVRSWCDEHPALVVSWREAPPRWGGAGAIVVTVRI